MRKILKFILEHSPGYNKNHGLFLFAFGFATSLTSISFFNSSAQNKRKARLAFKSENVSFDNKIINQLNYTVTAFTVTL